MSQSLPFSQQISDLLQLKAPQVAATLSLLDEGCTVPFIARYRKERTGALDEVQIRAIAEKSQYFQELDKRKSTILQSIEEQGKLSSELEKQIQNCLSKTELEDLYLPYKPKRRTRAQMAREKGLEPLAQVILSQLPNRMNIQGLINPEQGLESEADILAGAQDIVAETMAETAAIRRLVRAQLSKTGQIASRVSKEYKEQKTKFEQYYDFQEPLTRIPSHRYLALRRGEAEKVLKVNLVLEAERILPRIEKRMNLRPGSPYAEALRTAIADGYQRLLFPSLEKEVLAEMKADADLKAVEVFATNLRHLLLAAPLGEQAVIGIDPGLRTGSKCVALDKTGKFLEYLTIYPEKGSQAKARAETDFIALVKRHAPHAIAIGNGTGSREIEKQVRGWLKQAQLDVIVVQVSESGASIYSASDIAREEFPDLDLTIRGAISIARRLQDPLAELVKLDPKSIGVGQYQHDVQQSLLKQKLGDVVESCVNQVGVELNTSSAPLLSYISGIGPSLAKKIVAHREKKGAFANREALLKVSGLGQKAFEQAAGFLRVQQSKNPLDRSAVHPERYALVETMAGDLSVTLETLVGNANLVKTISKERYHEVGKHTLNDILSELQKPGRDPRDTFEPPKFREDVQTMEDLKQDMILEGIVTNVTAFGAFVDLGVHQDGLVHISQLADRFVRDPHDIVTVGDKLKVKVLDVDVPRKRISLSAKGF